MQMLPPPTGRFPSRDHLIEHVRTFACSQGYAVTIRRSDKDSRVVLCCDRGGCYRNRLNLTDGIRQRSTSSRLIGCSFQVLGGKEADGLWALTIKDARHNHEPSEDLSGHPSCRQLNEDERDKVQQMFAAGIRPRQMLSTLRQNNTHLAAISKTIYNARDQLRRQTLAGRTPIQALLDELKEGNFQHDYKCDTEGHITHLFFAHPLSITLTRTYPTVLLMDCTYKTNRFRMPLLNVVGLTCFNTTFFSCFIFLRREEREDYEWGLTRVAQLFDGIAKPRVVVTDRELALMNALETTFPQTQNLLCVWHIEKNVVSHCKQHFATGEE